MTVEAKKRKYKIKNEILKGIKELGRVEVLTSMDMNTSDFCDMAPCIFVEICRYFGDMFCI